MLAHILERTMDSDIVFSEQDSLVNHPKIKMNLVTDNHKFL